MAHHSASPLLMSSRERQQRVIVGGGGVVVLVLFVVFAGLPFARHWQAREATLRGARARVSYLESLANRTDELSRNATSAEQQLQRLPQRALHARSEPLAASMLQTRLQEAASANGLLVTRLEVTNTVTAQPNRLNAQPSGTAPVAKPSIFSVPATIAAYGDIVGVVGFMNWLSSGPQVIQFDRITLQRNSALLGAADVVQFSFDVRAPVIRE